MPDILNRDWTQIRQEYEANEKTIAEICKAHGISTVTLHNHRVRDGWTPRMRGRSTARPVLIERLALMLERQINHMEKNMQPGDEKDVSLVGSMARTLEKLMDLDRRQSGEAGSRKDPRRERELNDIKRKLAARLEQLRED